MQNREIGKDDITIRNCVLSYKEKQIPLISGEALARRTMKEHWPTILSRVKEMGLATEVQRKLVDGLEAKNTLRFVIGYARPFGKGKIIHVGSNPSPLLLKLILGQERKGPYVTCPAKGINTNIQRHEDGSLLLFVTNRTPESKGAVDIYLNLDKLGLNPNMIYVVEELTGCATIARRGKELNILPVVVRPHDVSILKISQGGARGKTSVERRK